MNNSSVIYTKRKGGGGEESETREYWGKLSCADNSSNNVAGKSAYLRNLEGSDTDPG